MLAGHLPQLALLVVFALIFFGPKRLPELGSSLGKGIRSFKSGLEHLEDHTSTTEPATEAHVVLQPLPASVPNHASDVPVVETVSVEHSVPMERSA